MKFIIVMGKVMFISFFGTLLLYIFECIESGEIQDIFIFRRKFYLYILFIVILGMLMREKIDH